MVLPSRGLEHLCLCARATDVMRRPLGSLANDAGRIADAIDPGIWATSHFQNTHQTLKHAPIASAALAMNLFAGSALLRKRHPTLHQLSPVLDRHGCTAVGCQGIELAAVEFNPLDAVTRRFDLVAGVQHRGV